MFCCVFLGVSCVQITQKFRDHYNTYIKIHVEIITNQTKQLKRYLLFNVTFTKDFIFPSLCRSTWNQNYFVFLFIILIVLFSGYNKRLTDMNKTILCHKRATERNEFTKSVSCFKTETHTFFNCKIPIRKFYASVERGSVGRRGVSPSTLHSWTQRVALHVSNRIVKINCVACPLQNIYVCFKQCK